MTAIPEKPVHTARAIDEYHARAQDTGWREHLGASLIGRPCKRALWYGFRWCTAVRHKGRVLRLFRRGQREEAVMVEDLRTIGVTVHERDPNTGEQFLVSDCGGHFGGSLDGAALGILEAPKTWHVIELKTHNEKSFRALLKAGVQEAKPEHWAQMQVYMGLTGMKRAYYLAVNKNDDDLYQERVRFDAEAFAALRAKAREIVFAPEPLERLSERPDWHECKWCDHHAICHESRVPPVSCRTCAHVTPMEDGGWQCERHRRTLDKAAQMQACGDHLFIPALIPYAEMVDSDSATWVKYRHRGGVDFWNVVASADRALGYDPAYTSAELHHAEPEIIGDTIVEELREVFDARISHPAALAD